MLTAIMKYVSIVVVVLGFLWNLPVGSQNWPVRNGGYMELLNLLVCLSALLVVAHGFGRYPLMVKRSARVSSEMDRQNSCGERTRACTFNM